MTPEEIKARTKAFALRVIRLVEALPPGKASNIIGTQLGRAATSVGANYRAACRARSRRDFISKMGLVEEGSDESGFWLELLAESRVVKPERLSALMKEAEELLSIAVASIRTARGRDERKPKRKPARNGRASL